MSTNKKAQEYCAVRKLDWRTLWVLATKAGRPKRVGVVAASSLACVMIEGEVCGLYGRSIFGGGHYYQTGRQGLYPCYPDKETKTLILCESIIDTASLQNLKLPLQDYALLAMYGTENSQRRTPPGYRKICPNTWKKIIFALDGDDAGRESVLKNAKILQSVQPDIKYSTLILPEGEDINSPACQS